MATPWPWEAPSTYLFLFRLRVTVAKRKPRYTPLTPAPVTPSPDLVEQYISDIRKKLRASASEKQISQWKRLFGDSIPCHGVDPIRTHHIGLEMVRRTRSGGIELAFALGESLWNSSKLEERSIAAQLVGAMGRHISGSDFDRFAVWASSLTNHANADSLAMNLISRSLGNKPSLVNKLKQWAEHPNQDIRRSAVMSFVPLVRQGRFFSDAFSVLECVMEDSSPQVQEAVGTVLMESARMNKDRVMEFIRPWIGKSPRTIMSKAAEKLTDAQRDEILSH